ncbi:MAG TPA: LacI family DNA-binding transcriptional regulator [Acetobacteraceae bacterium]|nr:LacI family DNA-binding transcriptional regulator [Acetobacteraceae bacterium]
MALAAGVSNATVSRVLNGSEGFSEATGLRVRAAVKRLNYRPSLAGSALRSGRNPIVALMLTDPTHAYSGAVAASVEEALRRRGKTMVLCNTREDPVRQDELLVELRAHLACGIVLLGAVASPGLERSVQLGEPVIFLVRQPPRGLTAPFVGIDDCKAGREVADYFLERGFDDCMLVHGPLSSSATADRVRGFRERFREARSSKGVVRMFAVPASRKEAGYALACKLLNRVARPHAADARAGGLEDALDHAAEGEHDQDDQCGDAGDQQAVLHGRGATLIHLGEAGVHHDAEVVQHCRSPTRY